MGRPSIGRQAAAQSHLSGLGLCCVQGVRWSGHLRRHRDPPNPYRGKTCSTAFMNSIKNDPFDEERTHCNNVFALSTNLMLFRKEATGKSSSDRTMSSSKQNSLNDVVLAHGSMPQSYWEAKSKLQVRTGLLFRGPSGYIRC